MEWTSSGLEELIAEVTARRVDLTDVEIKAAAGGAPSLGATICAFANMPEGGTIILGLDESSGFAPVGLTSVANLEQAVASQARTSVTPPVRCEFQTFEVAGKSVLVASVDALPLTQRPARHGGQAYLRQSDGDYVMSEQEIAQIELAKTQAARPTQPDRQPIDHTTVKDLDSSLLAAFLNAARTSSRRYATAIDDDVLRYTGVLTRTGEVSLAGLYALGTSPQSASPSLGVTAAVQLPPGSGARTRDLVHLVGPVPDLLEDTMTWVVRNTRTTMGYDARGHGVDESEIPMRAVREIVANALVHRNLDAITDSKRVEIRLLLDRLVITSPGGLWGVSESQLGRPGAKSAVNPVLYDICKFVRMPDASRVIEGEGGGIREAIAALTSAGLRPPRFVDTGIQFTAIITRHTLMSEGDIAWLADITDDLNLTSEQRAILVSMRHGVNWSNSKVRQEFAPTDSVAARRMLQQLVDAGLATARGERGSTRYTLDRRVGGLQHVVVKVEEVPPSQPTLTTDPDPQAANPETNAPSPRPPTTKPTTRRGPEVLAALDHPRTLTEIRDASGLSERQVRYALGQLIGSGEVIMEGSQGVRTTRYKKAPDRTIAGSLPTADGDRPI